VAKGSSEYPTTHFNQKWPQIVYLNAAINKDQTDLNSTKFFDFYDRIDKVIANLAQATSSRNSGSTPYIIWWGQWAYVGARNPANTHPYVSLLWSSSTLRGD
jgi:hypothetical protein